MRKIIFIIIVFSSNLVSSQNPNFIVEDGLINWNYIYNDSTSTSELKNNKLLEFKTDSTGYIKKTKFSNKKLHELTGEFKIETKKDKYRVTVYNIRFYTEPISIYSGGIGMQSKSDYSIEESLIKTNGTIRKSNLGFNLTETLNPHLLDLFTIKKKEKKEW